MVKIGGSKKRKLRKKRKLNENMEEIYNIFLEIGRKYAMEPTSLT